MVGPEVVTGSSRLKAGTAQKMVLNMISTATMVGLGYVSGNRMSNLRASNVKLHERALRILIKETGLETEEASKLFTESGTNLSVALVMAKTGATRDQALDALQRSANRVDEAVMLVQR